jgi:hypothetical protein
VFNNLTSNQQEISAVVGFLLPLVLSVPIQSKWGADTKAALAVGVYAVAAAVVLAADGRFTGRRWWEATLTTLVVGVASHRGLWQPTGVAPLVETATNLDAIKRRVEARREARRVAGTS